MQSEPANLRVHWTDDPAVLQASRLGLARTVLEQRRANPNLLQKTIYSLRDSRYLGHRVLAHLLARHPDDLLKRTLKPMVDAGQLKPAFSAGNDPRQGCTARTNPNEGTPEYGVGYGDYLEQLTYLLFLKLSF